MAQFKHYPNGTIREAATDKLVATYNDATRELVIRGVDRTYKVDSLQQAYDMIELHRGVAVDANSA